MTEFDTKLESLHQLIKKHALGGLLLRKISSFAWATCGAASYVNTAASDGAASLLITPEAQYVLADNIETSRIEKEEKLAEQGWKIETHDWYKASEPISTHIGTGKIGADGAIEGGIDISFEMARLRANLTPEEGERFRFLGKECAEIMESAIRQVKPGMSEFQIAGLLAEGSQNRGIQGIVVLVATDERIFNFRHPLPTDKRLERYAELVFCGRRFGLVCSITRLIHFGRIPQELNQKTKAVAGIDAEMILSTRPGKTLGQIFARTQAAYEKSGYANEWKLHHQGGPAGYEPREYIAIPESKDVVLVGQAYAWNPSITGTKSEDTILVGTAGNEILTRNADWPVIKVALDGSVIERPMILEIT
jgi:Xaa-Pro aminopeptidase